MSQPTLDEFRVECLAFLDANAKLREAAQDFKWGEGDDDVAMFEEVDPESERRQNAEGDRQAVMARHDCDGHRSRGNHRAN